MQRNDERTTAAEGGQGKPAEGEKTATTLRRSSRDFVEPYIPRKRQERSGLRVDYLFRGTGAGSKYLDFLLLGENRFGVLLADFSSIPTTLDAQNNLSLLKVALRSKRVGLSAAATLRYLDQHLSEFSTNGSPITSLYLLFDQSKRLLHYASAGHLPMLLHRPTDGKTYLLTAAGLPFGHENTNGNGSALLMGINDIKGESVALRQGDLVVLYNSGLLKQRNQQGEYFGRQRLVELFNKSCELNPTPFLSELQRRLDAFVGNEPQEYDVAVIAIKNTLRDFEKPLAETDEHQIDGRFLSIDEEQLVIDALREHPKSSIAQIAGDLSDEDLKRLGKERLQTYLAQTSHWLISKPMTNGHAGKNGASHEHAKNGKPIDPPFSVSRSLSAAKQMLQDLVAAFPIRQALHKKYDIHDHLPAAQRAVQFYNDGDYSQALGELSRAREALKNSAELRCLFGNVYLLVGMVAKAKHQYRSALGLDSRLSEAHIALSYVALLQEDFYTAIDELSTALRLDQSLQPCNAFLQQLIVAVEKRENRCEWLV